ncbi:hypothetical protein BCR35DRAFT_284436 [Leucosporidium creatinivorum]|uniref:F-box domain-containing protein n=1 Tax=Leucosporidium creatinivorum TaxID=106004 RepID=A0A1Y2D7U5_9BASI|nr:hypothetical protein BCR35DRAFT_284436 [Leucosporidium creatinivorum]
MSSSRRVGDGVQPGLIRPIDSQVRSITSTRHNTSSHQPPPTHPTPLLPSSTTSTSTTLPSTTTLPPSSTGYSEFHLAPATRTSVVTTTTTTTVHFAPILLPRSKQIHPKHSSFSHHPPPLTPKSTFANFIQQEERRAGTEDALRLDPKVYPLSQVAFPGGVKRFRMELGALEGVFYEDGRQAAVEREEREELERERERRDETDALGEEGDGVDGAEGGGEQRMDKGKGKAGATAASLSRSDRGPLHQRRVSRRPRSVQGGSISGVAGLGGGTSGFIPEEEDDDMDDLDSTFRISPGPPRKRPRANSHSQQLAPEQQQQRDSSVESDVGGQQQPPSTATSPLFTGGALGLTNAAASAAATAATLPSPNMSPPSPVPTFAGEDSQEDKKERLSAMDDEEEEGDDLNSPQFDLGSGQALSGLLSLPDFINTFDQLSPALQSYFIFTFLKRSSIPVLQTINNIVTPALRRDFLTDLPPELGVHILGFLDAKALCRASVVCKGWRRLADGEWRVWKERLVKDELWVGDGSEEKEAKEIAGGSKENLFLKRWRAGVWDQPARTTWTGKIEDEAMHVDAFGPTASTSRRLSHSVKLASPSSSREASPFPHAHFTHPYKILYRRRFETRRNWAEKTPKRTTFACNANNVVTCLQFDKDKIVSASDDHSINVFDTRTGASKARLSGHDGGVWALQYIGNILVSGSTDRTVRVWDLDRNKCTHTFVGHTSTVRCLQIVEPENINPDPHGDPIWEPAYPLIVTGSRDWSLRVWKLPAPGKDAEYHPVVPQSPTEENTDPSDNPFHLRHLAGHRHAVRALAAHGRTLVSGSYDCQVRVWDILTGECRHRLVGHSQKVYSVVFDHRRKQCASGSMDGTVRLWSTDSGECLATLDGHSSLVGLLGLSFRHLVSAAADSTLRIWDPKTGDCRHTLAAHSGAITCFQHDEYKVVSGSDGTLKMWDVRDGSFTRDLLTGLTGVWQVSFDQRFCVAAVQRNGQSEFEILDFGPVDYEEIQEEEERERREQLRIVKIEEEEDESSDEDMGRRPSILGGVSRAAAAAAAAAANANANDSPAPAPRLRPPPTMLRPAEFPPAAGSSSSSSLRLDVGTSTSTTTTPSRVVRRTGSSRNLLAQAQAANSSTTSTTTQTVPAVVPPILPTTTTTPTSYRPRPTIGGATSRGGEEDDAEGEGDAEEEEEEMDYETGEVEDEDGLAMDLTGEDGEEEARGEW